MSLRDSLGGILGPFDVAGPAHASWLGIPGLFLWRMVLTIELTVAENINAKETTRGEPAC